MSKNNKILVIVSAVILILSIFSFAFMKVYNNTKGIDDIQAQSDGAINFEPATQEDLQRAEDNKAAIEKRDAEVESAPTGSGGDIKTVTPVISYADQYGAQVEVGAYINDIYEDGGTCTALFTKAGLTVKKEVQSIRSAKSTDCPAMIVSSDEFPEKGVWSVTVAYESSSARGISENRSIEVN